jgi:hypothetical protein
MPPRDRTEYLFRRNVSPRIQLPPVRTETARDCREDRPLGYAGGPGQDAEPALDQAAPVVIGRVVASRGANLRHISDGPDSAVFGDGLALELANSLPNPTPRPE